MSNDDKSSKLDVASAEIQRCWLLQSKIHIAHAALRLALHELEELKDAFALGTVAVNDDGTNVDGRPTLGSFADFLVRELLERMPDAVKALHADEQRYEEMREAAGQRARDAEKEEVVGT